LRFFAAKQKQLRPEGPLCNSPDRQVGEPIPIKNQGAKGRYGVHAGPSDLANILKNP